MGILKRMSNWLYDYNNITYLIFNMIRIILSYLGHKAAEVSLVLKEFHAFMPDYILYEHLKHLKLKHF